MSSEMMDRVLGRSYEGLSDEAFAAMPKPVCYQLTHLFFSPEIDGRKELDRKARESACVELCGVCVYRISCLERAIRNKETHGVWGGTTEKQRREFVAWLMDEGYDDDTLPEGEAFRRVMQRYLDGFR